MPLTVTIFFDDNTPIDQGVNLQLLNGGSVVATALTASDGTVTFNVDPATLTSPAVNLAAQQTPPAAAKTSSPTH
jgi:hypothetical protein